MSRIGKKPVAVPKGVTAKVEGQTVTAKGPKGELAVALVDHVVGRDDGRRRSRSSRATRSKQARALWGMSRTLVQNIVTGVTEGFEKRLEISGVGYRAQVQGKNLNLALGYSHDVNYPIPDGIQIADAEADRDRRLRHRQAEGRPGGRRDPPLASAGALQGQGREICRRVHLPQGRQEEVTGDDDGDEETRARCAARRACAGR